MAEGGKSTSSPVRISALFHVRWKKSFPFLLPLGFSSLTSVIKRKTRLRILLLAHREMENICNKLPAFKNGRLCISVQVSSVFWNLGSLEMWVCPSHVTAVTGVWWLLLPVGRGPSWLPRPPLVWIIPWHKGCTPFAVYHFRCPMLLVSKEIPMGDNDKAAATSEILAVCQALC